MYASQIGKVGDEAKKHVSSSMGYAPEILANLSIFISILLFPGQIPINTFFQQLKSTRNMVGECESPTGRSEV